MARLWPYWRWSGHHRESHEGNGFTRYTSLCSQAPFFLKSTTERKHGRAFHVVGSLKRFSSAKKIKLCRGTVTWIVKKIVVNSFSFLEVIVCKIACARLTPVDFLLRRCWFSSPHASSSRRRRKLRWRWIGNKRPRPESFSGSTRLFGLFTTSILQQFLQWRAKSTWRSKSGRSRCEEHSRRGRRKQKKG